MVAMPHLTAIDYTPFDQVMHADLGGGGDSYYVYDSGGTRIRKVIDTGINLIKERIYLGSFEIYREIVSGTVDKERQTLHVLDGAKRIAMVETLTIDDGDLVSTPDPKQRYQLGNHLGSALLELDETGLIASYEEYHPYGTSAYRSARSGVEVSARRYRYVGMERDDETGLYLMGARYYACWLGRWTSADPMGIGADGPGLYNYTRGSPVPFSDPTGHERRSLVEGMYNPSSGERLKTLWKGFSNIAGSISKAAAEARARLNQQVEEKVQAKVAESGDSTTAKALGGVDILR